MLVANITVPLFRDHFWHFHIKKFQWKMTREGIFWIILWKPKLSRHMKLNATNIVLLLQETTQKYQKLTDY